MIVLRYILSFEINFGISWQMTLGYIYMCIYIYIYIYIYTYIRRSTLLNVKEKEKNICYKFIESTNFVK